MTNQIEVLFLEKCGKYAFENSIAEDPDTAHVVTLTALEQHMLEHYHSTYQKIMAKHDTLETFLRFAGRGIVRSEAIPRWEQWNYELLTTTAYLNDKRQDHQYFSPFLPGLMPQDRNKILMIFYLKEQKRQYEHERANENKKLEHKRNMEHDLKLLEEARANYNQKPSAEEEILSLYVSLKPTEKSMNNADHLRNRIQNMLDRVWPNKDYEVRLFGSSANGLATKNADIDLCIIVPESSATDAFKVKNKLSKQKTSVFNMSFLASKLRAMGMQQVEAIKNATVPICKFHDPHTNTQCDINANNVLGIENTRLIDVYCSLDTRIRPALFSLKYFVKQKDINNPRGGTLSSYAYVIMFLHYIMTVVKHPVIPSLQNLGYACTIEDCAYHEDMIAQTCENNNKYDWLVKYHDCVSIVNYATKDYEVAFNGKATPWAGYNKSTVDELLHGFFEHFSDPSHYTMSIIHSDGRLERERYLLMKSPIVIQDPFILTKNIARSCTEIGADIILKEFQRAAKLFSEEKSFRDVICNPLTNVVREIDTDTVEFRIKQKFLRVQQRRESKIAADWKKNGNNAMDKVIDYTDDEIKLFEKSYGFGEHAEKVVPKASSAIKITKEVVKSAVKVDKPNTNPKAVTIQGEQKTIMIQPLGVLDLWSENNTMQVKPPPPAEVISSASKNTPTQSTSNSTPDKSTTKTTIAPSTVKSTPSQTTPKNTPSQSTSKNASTEKTAVQPTSTPKVDTSKPIMKVVQRLLDLQPKASSSTDPFTKPCTDMSTLIDSANLNIADLAEVCYLIAQLGFLANTFVDKATGEPSSESSEHPYYMPESEAAYLKHLEDMAKLDFEEEEEYHDEYHDEDSDEQTTDKDVEEMIAQAVKATTKSFSEAQYDQHDQVRVIYSLIGISDDVDSIEVFNVLQWYGKILSLDYIYNGTQTLEVDMITSYANMAILPKRLDLGYCSVDTGVRFYHN